MEGLDYRDLTSTSNSETSDVESKAEVETTNNQIEYLLRAIQTRTQLLMEICISLEFVHRHANRPMKPPSTTAPIFHVSEAAQHCVRKVYDSFPRGDVGLIERLGEANWQRYRKVQKLQMFECVYKPPSDKKPSEQTLPKPVLRAASTFRDLTVGAPLEATSNITPFLTSNDLYASDPLFASNAAGSPGNPKVPRNPSEISQGKTFECNICHALLSDMKNRIDRI